MPPVFRPRHTPPSFCTSPFSLLKTLAKPEKYDRIEKCLSTHCFIYLGVAQFGSVPEWGSGGRRFNSCHPDHKKTAFSCGFCFVSRSIEPQYLPPLFRVPENNIA